MYCKSFSENHAVYEVTWKNLVRPDRSQLTLWLMRISRYITKATDTHPQYVILVAFPQQQW